MEDKNVETKPILQAVNFETREQVEQFAEYLKTFIDNGCSISFSETFSHIKVWEPKNGCQMVWLWTTIEQERVDDVCEYLVISFTKKWSGEETEFLKNLEKNINI